MGHSHTFTWEYNRLRKAGWLAKNAFRSARILDQFDAAESDDLVRIEVEPDCDYDAGEHEHGKVNHLGRWVPIKDYRDPETGDRVKASDHCTECQKLERDGAWVVVGQWRLSPHDKWQTADCCGGFVGDDWRDSGYDTSIMQACLDALKDAQADAARDAWVKDYCDHAVDHESAQWLWREAVANKATLLSYADWLRDVALDMYDTHDEPTRAMMLARDPNSPDGAGVSQ